MGVRQVAAATAHALYALHPDGGRIALASASGQLAEGRPDKVVFVFNFFDELRRLAPPSK